MSFEKDEAFGDMWDLGSSIAPDIIAYPIKKIITRDAEKAGININSLERRVSSTAASAFLGSVFATMLGPIGAVLGGLMGHAAGLAIEESGEEKSIRAKREADQAYCYMRIKAFEIAINVTREHVSKEYWSAIVVELHHAIDEFVKNSKDPHPDDYIPAYNMLEQAIVNSLADLDERIHCNFLLVHRQALHELELI